ncbi:MAG TPA: sulfatase [Acidimicrobiales bacterium]|nr:sulfatase [Acidimicrobiales bacterium]
MGVTRGAGAAAVLMSLLGVALAVGSVGPPGSRSADAASAPNVVVIMTDDQTLAQMVALPETTALLGDAGVTFSDAVVSYPMCCPSRATFLTGQYTQNNGVRQNTAADDDNPLPREAFPVADVEAWPAFARDAERRSIAVALEDAGYHTGLLGKYMNGYQRRAPVPPGWSDWRAAPSPSYWNTRLNENGVEVEYPGQFQTDVYREVAGDMIGQASDSRQPFFLMLNFSAPHTAGPGVHTYADRHQSLFPDALAPRSAAYDEADTSDKPAFLRDRYPRLSTAQVQTVDARWRDSLRSLAAVDEAVGAIVEDLADTGELEDTVLIFTSDNGLYHGEHRIPGSKYLPYEPAIRVPLIVAGPAVADGLRGTVSDAAVANVDLAATILDLANVEPLAPVDGRSLLPLLTGEPVPWQAGATPSATHARPIYLMGVGSSIRGNVPQTYSGVRSSDGWSYIRWEDQAGSTELYDLVNDPEQTENLARDPSYRAIRARLERQRHHLVRCAGRSCDVPPYGYLDLPRTGAPPRWFAAARWADAGDVDVAFADGTFGPSRPGPRGRLLPWLWRYAGSPPAAEQVSHFTDVADGLRPALDWAVANGIVGDRSRFAPARPVTRAVWATWLWRLAGRPAPLPGHRPRDVAAGHPAQAAIRWLVEDPDGAGPLRAVGSSYGNGTFGPADAVSRESAVIWLRNLDRRLT